MRSKTKKTFVPKEINWTQFWFLPETRCGLILSSGSRFVFFVLHFLFSHRKYWSDVSDKLTESYQNKVLLFSCFKSANKQLLMLLTFILEEKKKNFMIDGSVSQIVDQHVGDSGSEAEEPTLPPPGEESGDLCRRATEGQSSTVWRRSDDNLFIVFKRKVWVWSIGVDERFL